MDDMADLKDINIIGDIIKVENLPDRDVIVVKPNDTSLVNEISEHEKPLFIANGMSYSSSTVANEGKSLRCCQPGEVSLMDKKTIIRTRYETKLAEQLES